MTSIQKLHYLLFVNIGILDSTLNKGTTTDEQGKFILENIPVGRYKIQVSSVGYETILLSDVLVTSGNNPSLIIKMKESFYSLGELMVRLRQEKENPLYKMATVSAKQLNMEEANRFAGGGKFSESLLTD